MDHLLLHCEVTSAIWNIFFSQLGLSWIMLRRVLICVFVCGLLSTLGVLLCGR
jgi:hypothetical protein